LLFMTALVGLACAESETLDPREPAGTAGSAGASGTVGSIGAGGIAGAGTTGSGGAVGTAGTTATAGTTGTAGSIGGRGGSTGVAGSTAGRGGTTGAAGTTGGRGGSTGLAGRGGTTGNSGRGGTTATAGTTGTGGTGPAATFTQVYNTVIVANCSGAQCHNPGTQRGVNFATKASAYSYATRSGQINRNDPMSSYIYFVMATTPQFMPPSPNTKVPADQLALVSSWITSGFPNN
jgi:hypothetical protein